MVRLDLNSRQCSSSSSTNQLDSVLPSIFDHTVPSNPPRGLNSSSDQSQFYVTSNSGGDGLAPVLTTTSYHFQTDYANMKNLQSELQRALDDLNGVHAQRLTKYIS